MKKMIGAFIVICSASSAFACDADQALEQTVQRLLKDQQQKMIEPGIPAVLENNGRMMAILTKDQNGDRYTNWVLTVNAACEGTYLEQ